jgi:DNA (cytosine-5)-methyltransferase 1
MRTMHLFAGAGGGLLADLILGHTPVIAVEWDRYACQVLRERAADGWFPELRVWEGDVRLFDPSEYTGRVDCIHAGFPCQDISVAGKQAGVGEETRSGLYREVLRIAGVVRPHYLFLENVAAIVTNGLGTVLADLAALGYDCEWLCLPASQCGAPHERDRFWLLGNANDDKQPVGAINDETQVMQSIGQSVAAHPDGARQEEMRQPIGIQQKRTRDSGDSWWDAPPDLPRVANGVAHRMDRLKAIGNGQVPLQAAVAWKLLGGE